MDIHNTIEDIVFSSVQMIFAQIKKEGNPEGFCFCDQCQMDTICYTLNRLEPHYIVSNRGFTRMEHDGIKRQQVEADIATLVYKGLRLVNHNQRPTATHETTITKDAIAAKPSFDIPTILGRIFDGVTFAPISDAKVLLRCGGELVPMRNANWQNPYSLVSSTPGTFTFWPAAVIAEAPELQSVFEYTLKIESSEYEDLTHFFKIPAVSKMQTSNSYSLDRTHKLPDLYLFPPGEAEQNGDLG